ncbi:cell morphogenesis N-terminal-domain-containing protein [Epithele typhae]|uniref:cell morphogenesis N-terminal-domain-containing protein n=1 Tax=Epithele typhae TaxID=378194 RepID=UPI0020072F2C|nr:cell morphogenesis N-terminal-domain-containing protein [Epithele typhae]KAH9933118.1 cell morphogenesis N-terminal-domain-containing protein [Epithele typhae]
MDSPTLLTPQPMAERSGGSYFHSRGDSIASQDSAQSVQMSKSSKQGTHTLHIVCATNTTSPFTKKSSFASLRNAFKSTKHVEAPPPLPALDYQAYPALKNPFNRSTSSLGQNTPPSLPDKPQWAQVLPSSELPEIEERVHSQSGSIFHASDNGSEGGTFSNPFSPSPPPVPPIPSGFNASTDDVSLSEPEDKIVLDPRTPSDYALHAVFIRFASTAETHIDEFLRFPLDRDVHLEDCMGLGVDEKFDDILSSLGKIAQRHAKPVVDSIMRWRKSQNDPASSELALNERKWLASVYIMCRALIAVTRSVSKDGLPEAVGRNLEELTFEQFKRYDLKLSMQSANFRCIAEVHASLLGQLSDIRFETVSDRFLVELGPVAAGQVGKDDTKFENLVKGLRHLRIKVWPPESFEEGAEFLSSLSKSFDNAHGYRFKTIFAETLVQILHPIAKTAQAEVNHPDWAKAIEMIYPKARDMMVKPRYWQVAYPLAVTSLCVAPTEFFQKHWLACFEAGQSKLKEKLHRIPVLNGMLRLLWTYLYRCHESMATASSKIDTIMKQLLSPNRLVATSHEDYLQPFVYVVHFILSRHFDSGSELCLDLLQERSINGGQLNVAPEKVTIAINAILLSIHLIEREEPVPSWPSNFDFASMPVRADYPTSSNPLPASVTAKASWNDFLDRATVALSGVALSCFRLVGSWSVLDDQWTASRLGPTYEETHNHVIRHHPEGSVAYSEQFAGHITTLQVIYQSWPRLLHSSLALEDAIDMLIRGVIHIEPSVGEASTLALQRIMADPAQSSLVLNRFSAYLFDPIYISQETGIRLPIECTRLLNLWYSFVDRWVQDEHDSVTAHVEMIQAGALFLLGHRKANAFTTGAKAMRLLKTLMDHMHPEPSTPTSIPPNERFVFVHDIFDDSTPETVFRGLDNVLETSEEVAGLTKWRQSTTPGKLVALAESDTPQDRRLWIEVYPLFVQSCMYLSPTITAIFREKLVAAAIRGNQDGTRAITEYRDFINQWHFWIKLICATAPSTTDSRPMMNMRDHSRARSDSDLSAEQMQSSHDLFWALSKFLDSDYAIFRDGAVSCMSSFPASNYSQLLEDLSKLQARQHYDDPRLKSNGITPSVGRARRLERFYTALARIYFLTGDLLQDQRFSGKQAALTFVLKYIRNTQTLLVSTENRDRFDLQRLRRYFCGTIERLFYALATLKDSDRFIPSNLYLTLYTMCEEWCQLGKQSDDVKKRLVYMQTMAAKSFTDAGGQAEAIQIFQTETRGLSNAAIGAMAAVCQKAFFPPDVENNSPTDRQTLDFARPLQVGPTLDRLTAILASFHEPNQEAGKRALRSLLCHHRPTEMFLEECVRRAFVTTRELDTSNARFFEVVADAIYSGAATTFSFAQTVCLGLSNLCHPLLPIRRQAFNIMETLHEQSAGIISLCQYEAAIGSSAPSTYMHAHRLISDVLAGEHPEQAIKVLAQLADWIPRAFDGRSERGLILLLQTLEYWVPNIDLMSEDRTELSREGRLTMHHLMALTLRFSETYAEQILVLWTRLVDPPNQTNGHAVIRFLLEQSHKVGSTIFISAIGRQVVEEVCSVIEPARMLPSIEHKLAHPNDEDLELWSDLDILFSEKPRLSLGIAQFALLFLSETALERYWEFQDQLPVLFHALFMHLDHRQPFVAQRSRHMLFQLLRSCLSGYDELPGSSVVRTRAELKTAIQELEKEAEEKLWKEDDDGIAAEPKLKWFGTAWGTLALNWGTACSIRPVAFRSLQLYRALMPRIGPSHKFNVEILSTLTSIASTGEIEGPQVAQLYWSAVAFPPHYALLEAVVTRFLFVYMPPNWTDWGTLQSSLLMGLRSSETSTLAFKLLQRLTKIEDSRLIDPSEGRVRDLYTLCLPWCLHAMAEDIKDESLQEFALNISRLAEAEERPSIERIMISFAKSRFRTRDDFLRQSVASLREHYGVDHWTEVITLLMGLVLNRQRWLRVQTMQLLKVLFQQRETKSQVDKLGSELLMPLLRLLESDLAAQALDVLDEPLMQISGGPAAKHVLRMSLHHHLRTSAREVEDVAEVFGLPQSSGWCVPHAHAAREAARANVAAVFGQGLGAGAAHQRPSRIDFEPDDGARGAAAEEDDLGDMVQNLHELSSFFQEDDERTHHHHASRGRNGTTNGVGGGVRQLEARVAAILAKSSTDSGAASDVPPTPFVDVFHVGGAPAGGGAMLPSGLPPTYEDSEDDGSDSDSDSDLFEYDSPSFARFMSPSAAVHGSH